MLRFQTFDLTKEEGEWKVKWMVVFRQADDSALSDDSIGPDATNVPDDSNSTPTK